MSQIPGNSAAGSRKWQIVIIGLIVLGLLLVGFFGLRAARSYIRLQQSGLQPGVTDVEAIRGWMTIPYIGTAYGVPADYIFTAINIPAEDNQAKSISTLNRTYAPGQPGVVLNAVKAAVKQYQADPPEPARSRP